jgi:hypothetical protein
LFQHDRCESGRRAIALLEQPSSRRMRWQVLGRRNIVLSQSDELNPATRTQKG